MSLYWLVSYMDNNKFKNYILLWVTCFSVILTHPTVANLGKLHFLKLDLCQFPKLFTDCIVFLQQFVNVLYRNTVQHSANIQGAEINLFAPTAVT